jgi:hypothetical protein
MQAGANSANTTATQGLGDYQANLQKQEHDQNMSDLGTYSGLLKDNPEAQLALTNSILGGSGAADAWRGLFNADGSMKIKAKTDVEKQVEKKAADLAVLNGGTADQYMSEATQFVKGATAVEEQTVNDSIAANQKMTAVRAAISSGNAASLSDDQLQAAMDDPNSASAIRASTKIKLGTEWDKHSATALLDNANIGDLVEMGGEVYKITGFGGAQGDNVQMMNIATRATRDEDMLNNSKHAGSRNVKSPMITLW